MKTTPQNHSAVTRGLVGRTPGAEKTAQFTVSARLAALAAMGLLASPAWADSFTLGPGSPTLGFIGTTPGSVLYDTVPLPTIGIPFGPGGMGLLAGDVVDALSDGFDPVLTPHIDFFSVTPGSAGAPASGVATQVALDTPPGATPGHASDLFIAGGFVPLGTNILAPAGLGWTPLTTTGDEFNAGLVNPGDNVNAYDLATIPAGAAKYFSLAAGSPTLGALGLLPGDILAVGGAFGPVPVLFLPGAALGLPGGADLDALALFAPGGVFGGPGTIEYSLTGGTAGLVAATGGDILGLAAGVVKVHPFATIGLLPGDDLDALDVMTVPEPASMSLLALGALAIAGRRTRKG